jgi:hypothetical protein
MTKAGLNPAFLACSCVPRRHDAEAAQKAAVNAQRRQSVRLFPVLAKAGDVEI